MPKRTQTEDFFRCYGIPGVNDASVRRVIAKLHNEPEAATKNSKSRCVGKRFANLLEALHHDSEIGIYTVNLQFYLDTLLSKSERLKTFLKRTVVKAHEEQEAIPGCVYLDEVVPGNIIAPDNRRRSWCIYFCWNCLIPFRSDLLWMPLGIVRTDVVETLPGGLPQAVTSILRATLPHFNGLVLDGDLIITEPLYVLADEDGLKKTCSHKGASGLRPCIQCANCISKNNDVEGYFCIHHSEYDDFLPAEDETMLESLHHLQTCRTRSSLEEAEKLSGWKLNNHVFALDEDLWALLKPSRFIYDAMHCNWCNGICCQELGLFWKAALDAGIQRSDLEEFLSLGWKQSMQIGTMDPTALNKLVSPKLLRMDGSDYRGDATQTLQLVILMTYFAVSLLSDTDELRDHVSCLVALNEICTCILNAKLHPEQVEDLQGLLQKHLQLFKQVYGEDAVRPKHHFNSHLCKQVKDSGIMMDCWPTERKNKVFKRDLAPRIARLRDFEKSILLRWVENDINQLVSKHFEPELVQPIKKQPVDGICFGKSVRGSLGQVFTLDNVLLFHEEDGYKAMVVVSCFRSKELGLIGQRLHLEEAAENFFWSRWSFLPDYVSITVQKASETLRTSFFLKDQDTITLLR